MTVESANQFFDKWRWMVSLVGVLSILGATVAWPGQRISRLEEQRAADHVALVATTTYLRVLATAQCLNDSTPQNTMLALMCNRVLSDPSVLALPR
jgi:hypothetical protein